MYGGNSSKKVCMLCIIFCSCCFVYAIALILLLLEFHFLFITPKTRWHPTFPSQTIWLYLVLCCGYRYHHRRRHRHRYHDNNIYVSAAIANLLENLLSYYCAQDWSLNRINFPLHPDKFLLRLLLKLGHCGWNQQNEMI